MLRSLTGRPWIPILTAVLWSAVIVGYVVATEQPVGKVRGTVVSSDTGLPISEASVSLTHRDGYSEDFYQYVSTDENGEFKFDDVPVGSYRIEANGKAHHIAPTRVAVREGRTEKLDMELAPINPYLNLYISQRNYTSDEKPEVVLDGFTPSERVTVSLRKLNAKRLLSGEVRSIRDLMPQQNPGVASLPPQPAETMSVLVEKRDSEGIYHQKVVFAHRAPGLYMVNVSADGLQQTQWLSVSDIGLVIKHSDSDLLAYTVQPKTGQPAAGVEVRVFSGGQVRGKGVTDETGLWRGNAKPTEGEGAMMALARQGDSIAFVNSNYYEGEEGPGGTSVYAYTERPIYRPGHTVHFRGIVRDFVGDKYVTPRSGELRVEANDPRSNMVYAKDLSISRFGTFHGDFALPKYAPTGQYELHCRFQGQERMITFAIAEYSKPEFEVSVETNERCVRGDTVKAKVRATYFFGAPVVGAKVRYSISRSDYWSFGEDEEDENYSEGGGEYEDYGGYGEEILSGNAVTGPDGTAEIEFRAQWNQQSDDYNAIDQQYTIAANVMDISRREAEGEGSIIATQGDFRLNVEPENYMTNRGQSARFTIKAIDYEGKPQRNVDVDVAANLAQWENDEENYDQVASGRVTTDQWGRATFAFKPDKQGQYAIRAVCRDDGGRRIRSATWIWVPGAGEFSGYRYPNLQVILDKKTYNPGDTAKVLINSKETGATALVTVEGRRLYDGKLVKLQNKSTVIDIPIKQEYKPNFYISVCYVKDKQLVSQQARAKVSLDAQTIKLSVTPDRKKYEPGDTATYLVKSLDGHGKPVQAEVSLGVVDEAIYQIQEDETPAMRQFFYAYKPNGVRTAFSFPEEYYSGDKAGFTGKVRTEFVDTAFWHADIVTDAKGEARASFRMPDNLTTWRATARACSADDAFGETTSKAICSKTLLVRLETPRFLVQKDSSVICAIVHNYLPKRQTVKVALTAPGVKVDGDTSETVTIEPGGSQRAEWNVSAPRPGFTTLTAYASGQGASDAMRLRIPIRPHGQRTQEARTGSLTGGSVSERFVIRADAVRGASEIRIRLAPSLASSLLGSLDYLAQYPYGCTEQTTSSFLPDVVIWKSLKTFGVENTDLKKKLPDMVSKGLNRLYDFQNEGGGWGWCRYDGDDLWMTSYVVFALITARDAGFAVNSDSLKRGVESIIRQLNNRSDKVERQEGAEAYALYVLSLAKQTPVVRDHMGAFLQSSRFRQQDIPLVVMALANTGDKEAAKRYLAQLWQQARIAGGEIHWGDYGYYEVPTQATAQALMAIQQLTPKDSRIPGIVRWLLNQRKLDHWYSTRDTAMILYALSDYLNRSQELQPDFTATVTHNGRVVKSLHFDRSNLFQPEPEITVPTPLGTGSHYVRIDMKGKGALYYTAQLTEYIERRENPKTISGSGITITREYHKLVSRWDENRKTYRLQPADSSTTDTQAGDVLLVRLTVRSTKERYHMLVEDYLPAGCEAFDRGATEDWLWEYWWADQDVRDERVSFYLDVLPRGKSVLEYQIRATTPGGYHALPTLVEAMYDPSISGYGSEDKVTVR